MRLGLGIVALFAQGALVVACNATPAPKTDDDRPTLTSVEIAELEISDVGSDRFTSCPPPGELGQKWIPPIPAWTAIASSEGPTMTKGSEPPHEAPTPVEGALGDERGRAERVIVQTRAEFRRCYRKGLFDDPTQDGHVAIALRVDKDGRVQKVESYGACDIASEAVTCMKQVAGGLHFQPTGKADTIVVPVVFAGTGLRRTTPSGTESYTADAYVAIEAARPALHACTISARRDGKSVFASAIFTLDLDGQGKVSHAHVDNWSGDQDVLTCAAEALASVVFPQPPAGAGKVLARLAINPRLGTR